MFFSTELLSRRDSGYGLLWLAATLGSKIKKLPRRDVLTADIQKLCSLISEPPEPLALRLSSNLMVGVVRVYKMKHEIFQTDVNTCFASLKKSLQELHSISDTGLDMVQPNLRADALNIVVQPGIAMLHGFEENDMKLFALTTFFFTKDCDMIFRKAVDDSVLDEGEFITDHPAKSSSFVNTQRKLYQLDESHEHLFSAPFLNSIYGEPERGEHDGPSSSTNDVFFDLDFGGDLDIGLGEEMVRELEEAWNLKPRGSSDQAFVPGDGPNLENFPMDVDLGLGDETGTGIGLRGDAFGAEQRQKPSEGSAVPEHGDNEGTHPHVLTDLNNSHISPYIEAPGLPCLSQKSPSFRDLTEQQVLFRNKHKTQGGAKVPRKKVTLVDPRIELTDEQLKGQRDNYPSEMRRLRREAQAKKELRERKRRIDELIWAPPKDFVAPELIEWYKQRVVYPIKASDAASRQKLEELTHRSDKRRRIDQEADIIMEARTGQHVEEGVPEVQDYDFPMAEDIGHDVAGLENPTQPREGPLISSHRSSDSPGQLRRGDVRLASPPRGDKLRRSTFDNDPASLFPWDRGGSSSSNAAPPGSFDVGSGDFRLSMDSAVIRIKRSSKSGSTGSSPFGRGASKQLDMSMPNVESPRFAVDASVDDANVVETQEFESIVTIEKNSFNFLEYAKMHTVSNSKRLFFADLVPLESSSARVAAEGFYHCLALATKDLIRLTQDKAYGPIEIQIKGESSRSFFHA